MIYRPLLLCLTQKRAKVSREMRFLDEDDEDDSDWEQQRTPVESVKWFCVNCTMPNPGDMVHCYVSFFMFEYFCAALAMEDH